MMTRLRFLTTCLLLSLSGLVAPFAAAADRCTSLFTVDSGALIAHQITELAAFYLEQRRYEGTPLGTQSKAQFAAAFDMLAGKIGRDNLKARLRDETRRLSGVNLRNHDDRSTLKEHAKNKKELISALVAQPGQTVNFWNVSQNDHFILGQRQNQFYVARKSKSEILTEDSFELVNMNHETRFGVVKWFSEARLISYQGRDVLMTSGLKGNSHVYVLRYLNESGHLADLNQSEQFAIPSWTGHLWHSKNGRYLVGQSKSGEIFRFDLANKKIESSRRSIWSKLKAVILEPSASAAHVRDDGSLTVWMKDGREIEYDNDLKFVRKQQRFSKSPKSYDIETLVSVSPDGEYGVIRLDNKASLISMADGRTLAEWQGELTSWVKWFDQAMAIYSSEVFGSWHLAPLNNRKPFPHMTWDRLNSESSVQIGFEKTTPGRAVVHAADLNDGRYVEFDIAPYLPVPPENLWNFTDRKPQIAISHDFRVLAVLIHNNKLEHYEAAIIDLIDGRLISHEKVPTEVPRDLSFSDDGTYLIYSYHLAGTSHLESVIQRIREAH